MAIEKIEGVVIGETLFGESSKILKVFTRKYGIVSLMSKGCRRPKSVFKEVSNKLMYASFDIKYKEEGISTLVGASIIKIFRNIIMDYKDFNKKVYAFSLTDLTFQLLNQKQNDYLDIENVYDIYINTLIKIDEGFDSSILLDIVKLKYLKYFGVRPNIDFCSNCGTDKDILTISSSSFGYICKNCYSNEKIVSNDTIKMVRMLYYVDISRIKKLEIKEEVKLEIEDFLNDYYEEHTGVYFNMTDKLKSLSKLETLF